MKAQHKIKGIEAIEFSDDILTAINEFTPFYDEMTTSDLQGVCEARAANIFKSHFPAIPFDDSFWYRMELADNILEGIYNRVN